MCVCRYSREEPFTALNIDIRNQQHLFESLDAFVKGDLLEGANAYHCEKCDKKVSVCVCVLWCIVQHVHVHTCMYIVVRNVCVCVVGGDLVQCIYMYVVTVHVHVLLCVFEIDVYLMKFKRLCIQQNVCTCSMCMYVHVVCLLDRWTQ